MKRLAHRSSRAAGSVVRAFLLLFAVSAATSWAVWERVYDGFFKERVFFAVLLGNVVTAAVGAFMVASARRWR